MKNELDNLLASTASGQLLSKFPQRKQKVTPVSQTEQAKGFANLAKEQKANEEYTSRLRKIVQRANELAAADTSRDFNKFDKYLKQAQDEFARAGQPYEFKPDIQKDKEPTRYPRQVTNIGEGQIVKKFPVIVNGERKTLTYNVPPELANIFRHGSVDEIQNLTNEIIKVFAPETLEKDERYKYDKANAALDENFISAETFKNLKEWENKYIRSTAVGRGVQNALKFVQDESEAYVNRADNPLAKFAGMIVAGTAEDFQNPLSAFESKVGNIYDTGSTAEEWFGALGNAAIYGLSIAPFAKAGVTGANAMKAAEKALAKGLRIKAGLTAFARLSAREIRFGVGVGSFVERKITIKNLRRTLTAKGFSSQEIDDVINSQRKLYKMWTKAGNKGDFNDFLLQTVRNEVKSTDTAGEKVADAIGQASDVQQATSKLDEAIQEPDIPGYNVPTEQLDIDGLSEFENFINVAKSTGAIKTKGQENAIRRLMTARAETWAKENNNPNPFAMYKGMKTTKDDVMPDSALMQELKGEAAKLYDEIMKSTEKGVSILEADRLGIQPYVTEGGTVIEQRGGLAHISDPRNIGTGGERAVWRSEVLSQPAKSMRTPYKLIAVNTAKNLLHSSDGASRFFREIDDIAKTQSDPEAYKQLIFNFISKAKADIGTKTKPKKIADFKNLDELEKYLTESSFDVRKNFTVAMYSFNEKGEVIGRFSPANIKKELNGVPVITFEKIISKAIDPGFVTHSYGDVGAMFKSSGVTGIAEDFGVDVHPSYKEVLGGEPLLLGSNVPGYKLSELLSPTFDKWKADKLQRHYDFLDAINNPGSIAYEKAKEFLDKINASIAKGEQATKQAKIRDTYGFSEKLPEGEKTLGNQAFYRELRMGSLGDNPLSVAFPDPDKLEQYIKDVYKANGTLFQSEEGIARAWYNEANRQINFNSGLSNFSSVVHEAFHDWSTMLKPEHQATLARVFGDMTTVEAKEASARAFERYLRDGIAPEDTDLKQIFVSIKRWMTEVYSKLKGSPIEGKVDPEARRVFDEMLGGTSSRLTSPTSAKRTFVDADRVGIGLTRTADVQSESFEQWLDEGNKIIDDSGQDARTWSVTMADEILNNPRALSDRETGAMVTAMQVIKNNHQLLTDQLDKLRGTADNNRIKAIDSQLKKLEEDFDKVTLAVRASGTEKGRSLNAQKITINEDFSTVAVLNRYKRRSFDGDIPKAQENKLRELAQRIADLEKQAKDAESLTLGSSARTYARSKEEIVAARNNIADALKKSFNADKSQASMSAFGVPPTSGATNKLLVEYCLTYAEQGLGKIEDVVKLAADNLNKAGVPVTPEQLKGVLQAWVSAKKFKNDDLVDYVQQLKGELRNTPEVAVRPINEGNYTKKELAHFVLSFADKSVNVGEMLDNAGAFLESLNIGSGTRTANTIPREEMLDAVLEWGLPKNVKREISMRDYQIARAKREVQLVIAQGEKTNLQRIASMAWNTSRSIKATADFSAPFRQGALLGAGNPKQYTQAFAKALIAWANPVYANKLDKIIHLSPMAPIRKRAELYISEGALSSEELQFMQSFANVVPGVKQIVDASERHYTTFLNQLRVSVFDETVAKYPDMTVDEQRALADFINKATGRGKMNDSTLASNVFFSPRFALSRIQAPADAIGITKSGKAVWKSEAARKKMLTSWGVFLSTTGSLALLAKLNGASVELEDVDSPDWGKIRYGDTSIDLFAGFQQPARLIARLAKMAKSPAKELKGKTAYDLINMFADTKFAPNVSTTLSSISKKDIVGRPFLVDKDGNMTAATVSQDLGKALLVPLGAEELVSLWNGKGTNTFGKSILSGGIELGVGVQTYDRDSKSKNKMNEFEKSISEDSNSFSKAIGLEENKKKKPSNSFFPDFASDEYRG